MTNDELLHKWYNKTISADELEEFKQRPEYDSLISIDKETSDLSGPAFDSESMLNNILATAKTNTNNVEGTTKETSQKKSEARSASVFRLPSWVKYGVAASLLLFAGYFMIPSNDLVTYEIANAQPIEGTLPDQSTFKLAENSSLQYDKGSWSEERSLTLEGEAYFEVQKGSKFMVQTTNGVVAVLGTQFNVASINKALQVRCKEGKVSVISNKGEAYNEILIAGESMQRTIDGRSITWKNDMTKLKNVSLETVIEELSNEFGVMVNTGGIDLAEKLSCNFQHSNLELALRTSLTPLDVKYKLNASKQVELYK